MNREEHHREHLKISAAFKRTDENFKNVDIHVGEQLRRLTKLQATVDELYLNAMTRDRMWTALMEMLFRKGVFTKEEYDAELELLNKAIEKAAKEEADRQAAAAAEKEKEREAKVTVLSDTPAIPVVKG